MKEYDKTNRGSVWPNNKKTETHPDYTGTLNVEGVDYFLNMWTNDRKGNAERPTHGFSIKKKDVQPQKEPAPEPTYTGAELDDEDPGF